MKEMYTSEMYRSKLRLIRAMMVTMVMMRAFRYGMSGRDRGTSIPDRFLFTIVSNGTAPLPFLAHRDVSRKERGFFYLEPMGGGGRGDTLLVRSLCLFLPLNDRNSFFTIVNGKWIGRVSWNTVKKKKKKNKSRFLFNIFSTIVLVVEEYMYML